MNAVVRRGFLLVAFVFSTNFGVVNAGVVEGSRGVRFSPEVVKVGVVDAVKVGVVDAVKVGVKDVVKVGVKDAVKVGVKDVVKVGVKDAVNVVKVGVVYFA
jgi:hypothetical protein